MKEENDKQNISRPTEWVEMVPSPQVLFRFPDMIGRLLVENLEVGLGILACFLGVRQTPDMLCVKRPHDTTHGGVIPIILAELDR